MDANSYTGFDTTIEDPGILVVTFNNPERLNASTAPMKRDLVEVLTQAQMDDGVRVVLFTGAGDAFWAGDDLSGSKPDRSNSVVPPVFGG
ncbi:MAG: enoyl-CoA hydratase-related protein, partial [Actinomycetota bacterium]